MTRGSKKSYTDKEKRQASHIEKGYERRGPKKQARSRASATVNKITGGGKKSGSGRGKSKKAPAAAPEEGKLSGGKATVAATREAKRASSVKVASTLRRRGHSLRHH